VTVTVFSTEAVDQMSPSVVSVVHLIRRFCGDSRNLTVAKKTQFVLRSLMLMTNRFGTGTTAITTFELCNCEMK
jgi:hypothetical protein